MTLLRSQLCASPCRYLSVHVHVLRRVHRKPRRSEWECLLNLPRKYSQNTANNHQHPGYFAPDLRRVNRELTLTPIVTSTTHLSSTIPQCP